MLNAHSISSEKVEGIWNQISIDVQRDRFVVSVGGLLVHAFRRSADAVAFVTNFLDLRQSELRAAPRHLHSLTSRWPTVASLAREAGIEPTHLHTMLFRGSIPVEYWPGIIRAAAARGQFDIDAQYLLHLHTPQMSEDVAHG